MIKRIESEPVKNYGQYSGWQKFNGLYYYLYKGEKYYSKGNRKLHRVVWQFYNGEIPKGYDVHHVDENRANNDISNLMLRKSSRHRSQHTTKYHAENKDKTIAHLNRVRTVGKRNIKNKSK